MMILLFGFKVVKIIVGIIFLKSAIKKLKDPFSFYVAIKGYIQSDGGLLQGLVPMIILAELLISILLILDLNMYLVVSIGVITQAFYLVLILKNINKSFEDNCGCFELNTPQRVSVRHFGINLILFLFFVIIYGVDRTLN